MSTLYLIALGAVSVAILGALVDAVVAVSRRRTWPVRQSSLTLVEGSERRVRDLPLVGHDRRQAPATSVAPTTESDRLIA